MNSSTLDNAPETTSTNIPTNQPQPLINNIEPDVAIPSSVGEQLPEAVKIDIKSIPLLIAFVNFNSGGKMGFSLAAKLQSILGEDKVFNLAQGGPKIGLDKFRNQANLRIVVCGGDGTINWVLSTIQAMKIEPQPPVGIIPLGTGNDTARAFKWGYGFPGFKKIAKNLELMGLADIALLDRWHLTIQHQAPLTENQRKQLPQAMIDIKQDQLPQFMKYNIDNNNNNTEESSTPSAIVIHDEKQSVELADVASASMSDESKAAALTDTNRVALGEEEVPALKAAEFNNYLSFGVDAQIIHKFHTHRESHHGCYRNRIQNQVNMGICGVINFCCCQTMPISLKLEIRTPDNDSWHQIIIPQGIEAIVLLNLGSYAGGRNLWGKGKSKKGEYSGVNESYSDGLIEIVGLKGNIHLTMCLMKLTRAVRIAQAHEVKVTTKSSVFVQLDGEPYLDSSSVYHIRRLHQAPMLIKPDEKQLKK